MPIVYFTHNCIVAISNGADSVLSNFYGITVPIVLKRASVMKLHLITRVGPIKGKGLVIVAKKGKIYETVSLGIDD